jgi:hypothetical protein
LVGRRRWWRERRIGLKRVKRSPRSLGNVDAPSKEQYEHSLEDELVG